MTRLQRLVDDLLVFRDARDWRQFHTLRNLIVSLNLEAAELLELTQWLSDAEVEALPASEAPRQALEEECADVLMYLLLIADAAKFDLLEAASRKLARNAEKYPVEKSRGSRKKYTAL